MVRSWLLMGCWGLMGCVGDVSPLTSDAGDPRDTGYHMGDPETGSPVPDAAVDGQPVGLDAGTDAPCVPGTLPSLSACSTGSYHYYCFDWTAGFQCAAPSNPCQPGHEADCTSNSDCAGGGDVCEVYEPQFLSNGCPSAIGTFSPHMLCSSGTGGQLGWVQICHDFSECLTGTTCRAVRAESDAGVVTSFGVCQ